MVKTIQHRNRACRDPKVSPSPYDLFTQFEVDTFVGKWHRSIIVNCLNPLRILPSRVAIVAENQLGSRNCVLGFFYRFSPCSNFDEHGVITNKMLRLLFRSCNLLITAGKCALGSKRAFFKLQASNLGLE